MPTARRRRRQNYRSRPQGERCFGAKIAQDLIKRLKGKDHQLDCKVTRERHDGDRAV